MFDVFVDTVIIVSDEVLLAQEVAQVVQPHLHTLVQCQVTLAAVETVHMILGVSQVPHRVCHGEHQLTRGTPGSKHPVEVLLAVELTKLGEAAPVQLVPAHLALETVLVERGVPHPHHHLVSDGSVALAALRHPRVAVF